MAKFFASVFALFSGKAEQLPEEVPEEMESSGLSRLSAFSRTASSDPSAKKKQKQRQNWKICLKKKEKADTEEDPALSEDRSALPKLKVELASIRHTKADVICPICLKFICRSVTACCGHSFCELCINEYLLLAPVACAHQECIVCGLKIRGKKLMARCKRMDSIIEQYSSLTSIIKELGDAEEAADFAQRKREQRDFTEGKK